MALVRVTKGGFLDIGCERGVLIKNGTLEGFEKDIYSS